MGGLKIFIRSLTDKESQFWEMKVMQELVQILQSAVREHDISNNSWQKLIRLLILFSKLEWGRACVGV